MPRYFFHVHNGETSLDTLGTELTRVDDVRKTAVKRVANLAIREGEQLLFGNDWWVEVTDDRGSVLIRIDLSMYESPALRPD